MTVYYTEYGDKIRNPEAYARTGAPMYRSRTCDKNINETTEIYMLHLEHGKRYIGKTTNLERRMHEHFTGRGAQVTKKFKPLGGEVIDKCPGYFSSELEHEHTELEIEKRGYKNVRGGYYTKSKTLKKDSVVCYCCGEYGHYANVCPYNSDSSNSSYSSSGSY